MKYLLALLALILPAPVLAGATITTGQVSVSTSPTLVVPTRQGRQRVTLNVGAANTCAFGNPAVTASNGFALQPVAGASVTIDTGSAIYAICSATTVISFVESY